MSKKSRERALIYFAEAARIFGVSKPTFLRRLKKGMYADMYMVKTAGGWMADIKDVFRDAYPGFSEDTIALLIYQYRADLIERRGKKK